MSLMLKSDQLKRVNPCKIIKCLKRLQPTKNEKLNGKKLTSTVVDTTQHTKKPKSKLNRLYFNKRIIRQAISNTFHTFARDTTIHGVKHLFIEFAEGEVRGKTAKGILLANKLIWSISCIICTIFCLTLMTLAYLNFFATLTTTTIESINYPISEVVFPAVTFCSVNKVYAPNTRVIWDLA